MERSIDRRGSRWATSADPDSGPLAGRVQGVEPSREAGPGGLGPSAGEWLDGYQRRVRGLAMQAAAAQAELAVVAVTASSPDGSVTLTVNSGGMLTGLTIGRPAEGLTRVQLAATILATAHRAQADAASRTVEVMRPLIGGRSAAMTLLLAQLPDPAGGTDPPGASR